jgi:hypothetical protein
MEIWETLKIKDIDGTWYLLTGMIRDVIEVEAETLKNMNNKQMLEFIKDIDIEKLKNSGHRMNVENNGKLEILWHTSFTKEEYLKDSNESVFNTRDETDKIEQALSLAFRYSQIDGTHHKDWVIDQMVKVLTGKKGYDTFLETYEEKDENGIPQYEWNEGIAP